MIVSVLSISACVYSEAVCVVFVCVYVYYLCVRIVFMCSICVCLCSITVCCTYVNGVTMCVISLVHMCMANVVCGVLFSVLYSLHFWNDV